MEEGLRQGIRPGVESTVTGHDGCPPALDNEGDRRQTVVWPALYM